MNHIQPQPSACSFSSDIRNQRSLKHILDFTRATPAPTPDEIRESILLYMHILHDCQTANIPLYPPTLIPTPGGVISEQTRPVAHLYSLFRCLYEYSPTPAGRTNIVQTVLHALFPARPNRLGYTHPATRALSAILHRARCWFNFTLDGKQRIYSKLQAIADDLLRGFFVQFKAQGGRTPSVSALITPRSCYEVCLEQGTTGRSKNLRQLCLQRDDNRCIITRNMDACYAEAQIELAELNGTELPDEMGVHTEVVHIIPHALNELGPDGTLVFPPLDAQPSLQPRKRKEKERKRLTTPDPTGRIQSLRLAHHGHVRPRHHAASRRRQNRPPLQRTNPLHRTAQAFRRPQMVL